MFHTPAHKQTNPAALPAQIVNPVSNFVKERIKAFDKVKLAQYPNDTFVVMNTWGASLLLSFAGTRGEKSVGWWDRSLVSKA